MSDGKIAIVVGVSGVGKSTLLSKMVSIATLEKVKLSVVNIGSIMFGIALNRNLAKSRDEIRMLNLSIQEELRKASYSKLIALKKVNEFTVIDTHYLVRSRGGYLIGLPKSLLDCIQPNFFAIVEAPIKDIMKRRHMDKTRNREEVSPDEIEIEQSITRNSIFVLAALYNANVVRVINEEGKVDEAARKLFNFLVRG
ncbi:MAG: adenylate kinase [Thermoproteota archaeon]|nr:adenylate kinase [Candidatus Brockarchaeota archaeon]MBO3768731.1 adenylate kinase [Candidatus Brockarchaeota archaeon]MBO3801041.1 adenylate kinase [Candidatus Brockarchaeota archaeon]